MTDPPRPPTLSEPPLPGGQTRESPSSFDNLRHHQTYSADYQNIERRSHSNTVFLVDEPISASIMPRPTHWSVAWSDLMMTMFVLFLCMYVYQSANQQFLAKKKPEIIGGDTTEALQTIDAGRATLPFAPIRPGLPLITAGTVKKVERISGDTIADTTSTSSPPKKKQLEETSQGQVSSRQRQPITLHPQNLSLIVEPDDDIPAPLPVAPVPLPDEDVLQPNPMVSSRAPSTGNNDDTFKEMYRLGKGALENNDLEAFASIDIVPDQTVRIILTSDLLFALGESELSGNARGSLEKIAAAIRFTPYMINVVGHTDNVPMRSNRFRSNWELSVARASSVARYLVEEVAMDPNQFVVSGYSSYRPIAPNTTTANRAKNRRVEIIISKRLPDPLPATAENLR
jgi:chemotaxis protein MotB